MSKITVIGHKKADTDSVVSAVVFSRFLSREGKDASPAVAGKINSETEFVFSRFKEEVPPSLENVEGEAFLVDYNELAQGVAENVIGVIDHHPLAGMKTEKAIFFRVEPLGSTATLIYKMINEKEDKLDKGDACLLLSAIISDTLNLTSATTTKDDKEALKELADISGEDVEELSREMFEAKSDFSGMTLKEVVKADMKEFEFSGKRVGIAVCETTSTSFFEGKNIIEVVQDIKKEEGYDAFFFGIADIIKQEMYLYPAEEEDARIAQKAFEAEDRGEFMLLPGVTSRKSQIVPPLSKVF